MPSAPLSMDGNASPPLKTVTVLISGSGTNLQALIDASSPGSTSSADGILAHARITHVISDRKDAYGLQRAQTAGIPTSLQGILPYKKHHPDSDGSGNFVDARRAYDADLAYLVLNGPKTDAPQHFAKPDLVVCAGFMRILTPAFLDPLHGAGVPIINLHPSLHGDLVGAHCIERAWEEFVAGKRTRTGVMVHYVIAEVDMGKPIVQREVEITGCGSLEELEQRIHEAEHPLIVEGARRVLEGDGGQR